MSTASIPLKSTCLQNIHLQEMFFLPPETRGPKSPKGVVVIFSLDI